MSAGVMRLAAAALMTAAVVCGVTGEAYGQRARRHAPDPASKQAQPAATPTPQRQADREPVRLLNPAAEGATDGGEKIWSGFAPVNLRYNDNPVIRVFMAQGGSMLVEVPDKDRFFAIHPPPAEPQLIVLDDSPTKATDRFFLVRPGKDFVVPPAGSKNVPVPAATVTVQMRSGMTFTIVAYPVRDLRLNVHRLVVMYSVPEVMAARKANSLAVNLGGDEEKPARPADTTVRFPDDSQPKVTPEERRNQELRAYALEARGEMSRFAGGAVAKDGKEYPGLGAFGREASGLRVAASEVKNLGGNVRLAIVAVSNRRDKDLRLSQSQPDLKIEIVDGRGKVTQQQPVRSLYFETNSSGGVVPGKGCVLYAIVYELPGGISSGQVLRAVVSEERSIDRLASVEVALR